VNASKVQKRATKFVHECKHLPYADRLKYLKLPTLKYRRHRGDMIETYKIKHGLYDTAVVPNVMMSQVSHTRGNMYKLQKMHSSMILENIFLLKELVTCGTLYHPWLSKHRHLIVLKMICNDFLVVKVTCWSYVFNIIQSIRTLTNSKDKKIAEKSV